MLVLLRNPYNENFQWTGDWSEESTLWTDQAQEIMQSSCDEFENTFCMSIQDYVKFFPITFICKYHDDYVFSCLSAPIATDGRYLFNIQVHAEGQYTFAVSQKSARQFPMTSTYQYSDISMILIMEDHDMDTVEFI